MKRALALLLAAVLGAGIAFAALDARAQALAPSPADERRADIAAFRRDFFLQDRSYTQAARAEAEARLQALDQAAGSVSRAYFELELARIVALADNGHTVMFAGARSRHFNRVGVRFVPFGEEFYVLRASGAEADLLGARLVSIDGRRIETLRAAARSLSGGLASWRDRNAGYFFESPEQLHALGLARAPEQARYRFRLPNGRIVTRTLIPEAADVSRPRANADRWLYPARMETEGGEWRTLLEEDRAPWSLREPDRAFRLRDAPELDATVIELRQNYTDGGNDLNEFLIESLLRVSESGRRNIVLDLRMNGGGDLNATRAWARRLPELVPGRVFVLTSPWTFSAAITTIGYMRQAAPTRVVIVGEQVGDRLDFYAEGGLVDLPGSNAIIQLAVQRHDYRTGCREIFNCYASVARHPIAVDSLAPDIAAPWTLESYMAGRDPAMEAVAAALRHAA